MARQETLRTFVAVDVSAGVRSRAAHLIDRLRRCGARVAWVSPDQMHLTLKFLGDVPMTEIPAVCRTVMEAAAELPRLEITVGRLGAFPDVQRPKTLWLGIVRGAEELVILHDYLQQRLAELGFRVENRRFVPHITLGRVRQSGPGLQQLAAALREHTEELAGQSDISELVVYSSQLSRDGALHEPIAFAPLIGV